MNARTDFTAVADAQASPGRPALGSLLARWRTRLQTWRRPHRVMLATTVELPVQGAAMPAATQAFQAWAAQHEGAAVELCLSSHGLLMLADEGVFDAGGAQALRERAIERWTHYLDLPAEGFEIDWLVQTSLDMGRAPVAVACALPRSFCEGLLEVARRHGVRLMSIEPWWARGLQQAWQGLPPLPMPPAEAMGSVGDEKPVAALSDQQGDAWQRRWAWREGAWQTQARAAAEPGRWVLRSLAFVTDAEVFDLADAVAMPHEVFDAPLSTSAPACPAVVAMPAPPSASAWSSLLIRRARSDWAESLNFAGPRVRTSFWSWALLALGAIAVVHALELAGQVDEAQEAVQAEVSRLQAHAQPLASPQEGATGRRALATHPVAAPAPSSASSASASSPAELAPALPPDAHRSAAQLAAWLAHPWAEALDHADATAHRRGISLTRFQLDLGTWGTRADQPLAWRLQAAVPDDGTALAWVRDLGPQAELQRRDALAQSVPSERGTLAWRIDVSGAGRRP